MKHLGKNLVIALALIGAGFFVAWLRYRPHLGTEGTFTDGARVIESVVDEPLRYALWDTPQVLRDEDGEVARGRQPTLSPDGRWLVFVVGERGLNAELWIGRMEDGRVIDPRPLDEVNGPDDEVAPAFAGDALYFASNRAGAVGGLDLWRAEFADGVCADVVRLAEEVNTRYDETDPAPLAGGTAIAFASNRPVPGRRGHDLYLARRGAQDRWEAQSIEALNSLADDRDPAFTPDGRTLVFASNRDGDLDGRDFDLYRSLADRGTWLAPVAMAGLNSELNERDPQPVEDGFGLLYSSRDGDESEVGVTTTELRRARSLELFRRPGRPIGLFDVLLLAALLLLALLAILAKRWRTIEVIYRCFLASVVAHLLLLWWFQRVHPEQEAVPVARGDSVFQVRLASDPHARAADRAHGGELQLARSEEESAQAPERIAEIGEVHSPPPRPQARGSDLATAPTARPKASADARSEPQATEPRAVDLADAAPTDPLFAGEAPAVAVRATHVAVDRSARPGGAAPGRGATAVPADSSVTPRVVATRPRERVERERPARMGQDVRPATEEAAALPSAPVALPAESFALATGEAAEVEVVARATDLERRLDTPVLPDRQPSLPQPTHSTEPAPARWDAPAAPRRAEVPTPQRFTASPRPAVADDRPAVDLRSEQPVLPAALPAEAPAEVAMPTPTSTDAPRREREREATPGRWMPDAVAAAVDDRPEARAVEAVAPKRTDDALRMDRPEVRFEHTPYRNRFGLAKERALLEHGGSAETEAAVAAGLEYLAGIQGDEGYWGSTRDRQDKYGHVVIGKTGLALLAFLGAGHTHASATEHSAVVAQALRFLLAAQDEGTGHFGNCSAYGHGIATYALAECFALTKDEQLRPALERALAQILRKQNGRRDDERRFGGWSYYYPGDRTYDSWPRVSITAWQVMALESARLSGLEVPNASFAAARDFLEAAWDPRRGAYRYNHKPSRLSSSYAILPASTPAALFALSLLGADIATDDFDRARRFVLARTPNEYASRGDDAFVHDAVGNLYFWYYASLAMLHTGGRPWEAWNEGLKATLLPAQEEDGSWRPISTYADYAGDDRRDRSYTTAMCVLSLEVYYRYFTPLLDVTVVPRDEAR